jgi:superfamily II DNA helicase RecQ
VEYLDGHATPNESGKLAATRGKVDYKEILSPSDFAVFAKLRDARKEIAQSEAAPVYTIFTNDQLAQMIIARATTRAALAKIEGVGESRLAKYGERILAILTAAWRVETVVN